MQLRVGDSVVEASSRDLSAGGACLDYAGAPLAAGERVELEVNLPGRREATKLDAEVRWTRGGRLGVMFSGGAKAAVAAFLGVFLAGSTANAAAAVPSFDPNADVNLDMSAGGERPDDSEVLEVFQSQFDAFDQCVETARGGKTRALEGDVHVEVLLNPKGERPLGVNAQLPAKTSKNRGLRDCLRSAVAEAAYPSYDGVPVVVEFDFELDPGFEYVEE